MLDLPGPSPHASVLVARENRMEAPMFLFTIRATELVSSHEHIMLVYLLPLLSILCSRRNTDENSQLEF